MKSKIWWILLAASLLLITLSVQASTNLGPGRQPWEDSNGARPAEVVSSIKCLVHEVGENRTLVLIDEADEQPHRIQLAKSIPLLAKSKKQFDGRRKLEFSDLQPGQRVKVTFASQTGEILRLKILESDQES